MFEHQSSIKLHDTDAAGLLFYGRQFFIVNDVYEHFLEQTGFSTAYLLKKCDFFTPIIHTEADYLAPLFPGDTIKIKMNLKEIGTSSITYHYDIFDEEMIKVGSVTNTHVCIDKSSRKSRPLPENFTIAVKKILKA